MTVRPTTLAWILLAWMLLVGAALGLFLQPLLHPPADQPRRTRPPVAAPTAGGRSLAGQLVNKSL